MIKNWKELDLSEELYQNPEKPQEKPPAREGGGFFNTLTFQVILCLAVAILMVLLNTFFPSQYRDIDRTLKEQIQEDNGFLEDLGGIRDQVEQWLGQEADQASPAASEQSEAGSGTEETLSAVAGAGGAPETSGSTDAAGSASLSAADVEFCQPLEAWNVTSVFGARIHPITGEEDFHSGIDLAAEEGEPVYAVCSGTIEKAAESDGYGKHLQLRHADGTASFYAHCSRLLVQEGETVAAGQEIALAGSTGMSTGPHLHFGYLVGGEFTDPAPLFRDA